LVNYGEYAHRLGIQVVNREAAEAMAEKFSRLWSRLARKFRGVPVYIGHPDDADFRGQAGHGDTRAYGWVQQLDARSDGLWIRVRWSSAGIDLLENAHYKFLSPRWEMEKLADNKLKPRSLLSVGLTNCPNLSVESIANEETPLGNERANSANCDGDCEVTAAGGDVPIAANVMVPNELVEFRSAVSLNLRGKLGDGCCAAQWAGRHLLALVNERMARTNENYTTAWRSVREIHPALFDEPMSKSMKSLH
jgi:hypothetical protein